MKVLIWVHKNDVLENKITNYYLTRPVIDRHDEYLQIVLTQDEFVKLEDNVTSDNIPLHLIDNIQKIQQSVRVDEQKDAWLVDQFNRNRDHKEQINTINDIESDQDNQPFGD